MQHLTYDKNGFYLCGKPFRILSGAIHYFRVPKSGWRASLTKLKAMGLNTVETYLAWNLHEDREGEFDFREGKDFAEFLDIAAELGLHALVRPGPYICAEWEFGGFPAWLLREPDMVLRSCDPAYLRHVDRYFDAIAPLLVPRLAENGGNIIGVQVENEYGSYGADKRYLSHLRDGLMRRGFCGCFFTSDGPGDTMLSGGTLPGMLKTVNFGSGASRRFPVLRKHQPDAPPMCCEFWDGWFDQWGNPHHQRGAEQTAAELEEILNEGGSFNLYMFHGGTNFGYMNGANNSEEEGYHSTITSYDYDSPLDEAGNVTEKYKAMFAVLQKFAGKTGAADEMLPPEALAEVPAKAYGKVRLDECALLWKQLPVLSEKKESPYLLTMEQAGQNYGFILYRTVLHGPVDEDACIVLKGIRDRALVFLDGEYCGVFSRQDKEPAHIPVSLDVGKEAQLDILVENMGRSNYGSDLSDNRRGILGGVYLDYQLVPEWEIYPLPIRGDELERLCYTPRGGEDETPAFYRGRFTVEEPADTYLKLDGWGKGVAFINGFHLGRYWEKGPQRTLYIPACCLRKGENTLELFELHASPFEAELCDKPILGE